MNNLRVSVKSIRQHKVYYQDLTNINDTDQTIEALMQLHEMLRKEPAHSALVLTDVEGFQFNRDVLSRSKDLIKANRTYIKRSAVGNVSTVHRMAANSMLILSGRRDVKMFATMEEAENWLFS